MATPKSGRTTRGTFAAGNPGGPGRPTRITELAYLRILMEACTPEKFREIVESTISAAKDGDAKARDWIGNYLLGSPDGKAAMLSALYINEQRQLLVERRNAAENALEQQSVELLESLAGTAV